MMTKYEYTNLVGTRAQQIDRYGLHFADLKDIQTGKLNALDIAVLELKQKQSPLLIKRHINVDNIELWNPNHMLLPKL
jgi:DNA-directed RNA polymerase subunit K/omega